MSKAAEVRHNNKELSTPKIVENLISRLKAKEIPTIEGLYWEQRGNAVEVWPIFRTEIKDDLDAFLGEEWATRKEIPFGSGIILNTEVIIRDRIPPASLRKALIPENATWVAISV